jgi:gamma-glutamylcyclotransferase (GGCT)/AIG2-like uncharacterized protein YtfP
LKSFVSNFTLQAFIIAGKLNLLSFMLNQPTNKVFVYGTLKPGGRYHHVAQGAGAFTSQKAYLENFVLYHLEPEGYPAIIPGSGQVHGYVFAYEDIERALAMLDQLEAIHDVPPEYTRQQVVVQPQNERVWVYVYARLERLETAQLIASGQWLEALPEDTRLLNRIQSTK